MKELNIEQAEVSDAELKLALQLIDQIAKDAYDPSEFKDEERARVLAAIDEKINGKQIVASATAEAPQGGQVIDLMDALRASLGKNAAAKTSKPAAAPSAPPAVAELKDRKGVKRAAKADDSTEAAPATPLRARARK